MRRRLNIEKLDLYLVQMLLHATMLFFIGDLMRLFTQQTRGTEVRTLFMLGAVILGYGVTWLFVNKHQTKRRGLVLLIITLLCIDLILCLKPEQLSILLHGLSHWFLGSALALMIKGNRVKPRGLFYLSGVMGLLYLLGMPLIYFVVIMIIAFTVSLSYKFCILWNNTEMLN